MSKKVEGLLKVLCSSYWSRPAKYPFLFLFICSCKSHQFLAWMSRSVGLRQVLRSSLWLLLLCFRLTVAAGMASCWRLCKWSLIWIWLSQRLTYHLMANGSWLVSTESCSNSASFYLPWSAFMLFGGMKSYQYWTRLLTFLLCLGLQCSMLLTVRDARSMIRRQSTILYRCADNSLSLLLIGNGQSKKLFICLGLCLCVISQFLSFNLLLLTIADLGSEEAKGISISRSATMSGAICWCWVHCRSHSHRAHRDWQAWSSLRGLCSSHTDAVQCKCCWSLDTQ